MLLEAASDDLVDPNQTRRLLKDLREVRTAKMRKGIDVLDAAAMAGGGVALTGVGAMEIGEMRGLVTGVVENLRYFSGFVLGYMLIKLHLRIHIVSLFFFFFLSS
jgi:GINS complex subunit 2